MWSRLDLDLFADVLLVNFALQLYLCRTQNSVPVKLQANTKSTEEKNETQHTKTLSRYPTKETDILCKSRLVKCWHQSIQMWISVGKMLVWKFSWRTDQGETQLAPTADSLCSSTWPATHRSTNSFLFWPLTNLPLWPRQSTLIWMFLAPLQNWDWGLSKAVKIIQIRALVLICTGCPLEQSRPLLLIPDHWAKFMEALCFVKQTSTGKTNGQSGHCFWMNLHVN